MRADGDAPDEPTAKPQAAPDLGEALHALGADSRAGLKAASDSLKALRILVAADFSLARSAFGRALAFTGVAIAFGASAWLLLMG
ncbi:MAG: phage holin family protein, partial [Lysobacteraceae bacterium]